MENQKYFYSALNDKESFYKSKGKISNNSKNLHLQKVLKKIPLYESEKTLGTEIKYLSNFSKLIHDKVKQYQKHPFRQYNLKIIGEDIKNKLFEMNIEDEIDLNSNKNIDTKKYVKSSYSLEKSNNQKHISNKRFFSNKEIFNISNLKERITKKDNKEENEENKENQKICIEIPQVNIIKKKKKKKKKGKLKAEQRMLNKYRKIKRIKNLCDSMDDDESEDEKDYYVINPESNIILIFDFLLNVFFLYYFIVTTINLAKEQCFCPRNNKNKNINYSDVLLIINDILCLLDLFISFFRGYYNYNYQLILLNKQIIQNYMKHDFFFDFLSAIPIFSFIKYICLNKVRNEQCFKYEMSTKKLLLKLFLFLKATKIKKILDHKKNQALNKFMESISENYAIERTFFILLYALKYIGIFHFFVCVHIFIGSHSYSNWLILRKAENDSFINIYIQSLYFIITTLTTVGYGDIICQSLIERIFQIILLAIGSVFYPYIVSIIGNLIENDSNAKIKQNNNLEMLEKIRRNYPNITFKLYNKIYGYLESKSSSLIKYDINSLIESLPFTLKNNILFTMYNKTITNFKFFKNNNNSVFIAEVLNNFIPNVSKKNEFLIYEGEMLEEIIFIKDGIISLNAAINTENPMKSINKYFFESFSPFTTEEEKKLINENINYKSGLTVIGDLNLDRIKNKINNAFRSGKNLGGKSQFELRTDVDKNDNFNFDVKGGAIINDEGDYQYLKVLDIRKNEHFGCVFMTLNKPCPLSIQVKSKLVELFLLKKDTAVNLSKNYPNIWRKIYAREFHNLRTIKKQTFAILKKYIEINDLLAYNNFSDSKLTNRNSISSFDINLNFVEKSAFGDKSKMKSKKKVINKKYSKSNSLNFVFDKQMNKINLDLINSNMKSKIMKKRIKRNSTLDDRINNLYTNNIFSQSNSNQSKSNIKSKSKFYSGSNIHGKSNNIKNNSTKENNLNNPLSKFNKKNYFVNNKEEEINKQKKRQKLKKLKIFLIQCKKNFSINKSFYNSNSINTSNKNNNININGLISTPEHQIKKSCLKTKTPDNIKKRLYLVNNPLHHLSNKSVEFDLTSNKDIHSSNKKFSLSENLLKDLKDICEDDESNFSFCSTDAEHFYKNKELYIETSSNFEIKSSYNNLNQITKGKYSQDIILQNKLEFILKNYNKYKSKNKKILLNDTLKLEDDLNYQENKNQKPKSKLKHKSKISKYNNKKSSKNKDRKKLYSNKIVSFKDLKVHDDFDQSPTYKIQSSNKSDEQSSDTSNDSLSIKVNKSGISSLQKKEDKQKDDSEKNSNKTNFGINIKKNINIFNDTEIEYVLDKKNNNKNSSKKNNNINIINNIKKEKKRNKNNKADNNKNFLNQVLGIELPNSNLITTCSNMKDNKNDYNSVEKIKNIENLSIYNIFQKNINRNLNIIDNNEKSSSGNSGKNFCCII